MTLLDRQLGSSCEHLGHFFRRHRLAEQIPLYFVAAVGLEKPELFRGLDVVDARIVQLRASGERWKTVCWKIGLGASNGLASLGDGVLHHCHETERRASAKTSFLA